MVKEANFIRKAIDTYNANKDYYSGKRSNKLTGLMSATAAEIRTNPTLTKICKEFNKAGAPYDVQVSRDQGKLQMIFDARKVPRSIVDKFRPGKAYDKYVNSYDPSSKSVEMIFDVKKKLPSTNPMKDVKNPQGTQGEIGEELVLREESSESKGNPLKSSHICSGCGNPIGECTCEIEDEIEESATQSGSIGQHKRSSIDIGFGSDEELELLV